ncbi:MAG TPA: hypothetical protein VFQ65_24175 [Kofleriaceae bacterium]|nr:hypothetical protein [Kofleriaceae bacterium]
MRLLVCLALAACSADHGTTTHTPDAPPVVPPDGDQSFCDAPANSSHVSIRIANVTTGFTTVHAGGVLAGGGVAPIAETAMSVSLLFVDDGHLPQDMAFACLASPNSQCVLEGIRGSVDTVGGTAPALGPHPIMLYSLQHALTVQGALTITDFVQPFDHEPGHITGSISTPDNSVSGTFENDFCSLLLAAPI